MKNKKSIIITTIVCLIPILMGLVLYNQLPDQIVTHFDVNGEPNGYSSKAFAVFGLPVFLSAINTILHIALENDPKKQNASKIIVTIAKWTCPVLSIIINPLMYLIALGKDMPLVMIIMLLCSILIIAMGNYMPKCKPNYTVGIKLPWTLEDEDNWNKTHRLAGFLWFAGGVIMLISSFLEWQEVFLAVILVIAIVPMVYSFIYYKKAKRK